MTTKQSEEQRGCDTWTVYAQPEDKKEIKVLLETLNKIIADEAGVDGTHIPKAKLIVLGLRTAIELKNPTGLR